MLQVSIFSTLDCQTWSNYNVSLQSQYTSELKGNEYFY